MLPLQEEIRRAWKPMGCFAANGTCQSLLDSLGPDLLENKVAVGRGQQ